jgi:hypothetical protein
MSLLPESWVDEMLVLCEAYKPPVSLFQPGQLLVSRKTARRATVAFCDQYWTTLSFSDTRSLEFPTKHVIKNYQNA